MSTSLRSRIRACAWILAAVFLTACAGVGAFRFTAQLDRPPATSNYLPPAENPATNDAPASP